MVPSILLNAGVTFRIDAVGAAIDTHLGRIEFLSVYVPPKVAIPGGLRVLRSVIPLAILN